MVTQNQNQIYELLNQKETLRFLLILTKADKAFHDYKKELERIQFLFEQLELKYQYLAEEDRKYEKEVEKLIKYLDKLKEMISSLPSPYKILNEAFEFGIDNKGDEKA